MSTPVRSLIGIFDFQLKINAFCFVNVHKYNVSFFAQTSKQQKTAKAKNILSTPVKSLIGIFDFQLKINAFCFVNVHKYNVSFLLKPQNNKRQQKQKTFCQHQWRVWLAYLISNLTSDIPLTLNGYLNMVNWYSLLHLQDLTFLNQCSTQYCITYPPITI